MPIRTRTNMQLQFFFEDVPITAYTFEGDMVSAPELTQEVKYTPSDSGESLGEIDRWVQGIRQLNLIDADTSVKEEISEEWEKDTNSIKFKLKLDSLDMDYEYNKTTKLITAQPRPAWAISFNAFLVYLETYHRFLNLIKEGWL